jgi:phosphoheptose isomerase
MLLYALPYTKTNSEKMADITIPGNLFARYPELKGAEADILDSARLLVTCFENGGKMLICGNGGSSADSDHIAGELMKGFEHPRPVNDVLLRKLHESGGERGIHLGKKLQHGFPVISLSSHTALITAIANDNDPDLIFAQQVAAYGRKDDVLLAISTSGNSRNVLDALITARALDLVTIGMTGESGGSMIPLCDSLIRVPGYRTSSIQELHFPVYHTLCLIIENYFFGNMSYEKQT